MPERTEFLPLTFEPRKKQKSIQENKIYERKEIDNIHKVLESFYKKDVYPYGKYGALNRRLEYSIHHNNLRNILRENIYFNIN